MKKLAIFGYIENDFRLQRVLRGGHYELLWAFPPGRAIAALSSMRGQPPEVLVVNPRRARELLDFRIYLPVGTVVIQRAQPFAVDALAPPLPQMIVWRPDAVAVPTTITRA